MLVAGRTLVRHVLPRGNADRSGEPHWAAGRAVPRWMKWAGWPFVGIRADDGFRAAGQRVPVSAGGGCWCWAVRRSRRSASASSTAARSACGAVTCVRSTACSPYCRAWRPSIFASIARPGARNAGHIADPSGQLRAAGAHPAHERSVRLPHVRALQRPSRRGRVVDGARRTREIATLRPLGRRAGTRC